MISATENSAWTLVVSKGQSRNPKKRELEQAVAEMGQQLEGVQVLVVPHLYDLPKGSESYKKLSELEGNLIVVSWIFSRAAHWVLDRNGIQGQIGEVLLASGEDDADEATEDAASVEEESNGESDAAQRVTDLYPRTSRTIHCIDLKLTDQSDRIRSEIERIIQVAQQAATTGGSLPIVGGQLVQIDEQTNRRWYPVIDFDRCTNCMECVDFCLFGVYGVDGVENILVEQPDNCRKGCPACSRVCPENAIIFPQHKAPAIAGANTAGDEGFKIDLSQLFGAPSKGEDPIEVAARERDEQLLLAGRDTVGIDDQLQKRQADRKQSPKDELDRLIDQLDALDL
ncbi:MAG: ferredoxin family protein [Rubripirellula sp.]|jgi:NAD-dependent dihydropyrimidine dehydrogenase PreA subunit|nr:ferredoxin family protein [Rubripirellula sp.]